MTQLHAFQQKNQPAKKAIIMCLPKKMKHKFKIFLFLFLTCRPVVVICILTISTKTIPSIESILQHQFADTLILNTQPSIRRYAISHLTRRSNIPKLNTKENYEYFISLATKSATTRFLSTSKLNKRAPTFEFVQNI
jgi:hypothetical protein